MACLTDILKWFFFSWILSENWVCFSEETILSTLIDNEASVAISIRILIPFSGFYKNQKQFWNMVQKITYFALWNLDQGSQNFQEVPGLNNKIWEED